MRLSFWILYYPLLKLLSLFVFWIPEFQLRKKFERQNRTDPLSVSFKDIGLTADLCFEFSSEGEYQQVAGLIEDALRMGKRVELVFFSPSVEKTIMNLGREHSSQLRYLRYPLISLSPYHCFYRWVTSRKLIMVRYDLFPEFLAWARGEEHELSMVWMSFKKERASQKRISWMKRSFLKASKKIIYASEPDQAMGKQLGFPGLCYDFRIEQIRRRVAGREAKFASVFEEYPALKSIWESFPRHKRLLIGNAWPSDLFLFETLPEDFFVLVVPHQLTPEIIRAMEDGLPGRDGQLVILNKKGVLCELYADFGLAYVGGGFETGVHSVLEPLVAGCEGIACGLLHHRSTEFDLAHDMGKVSSVGTPAAFLAWLNEDHSKNQDHLLSEVFGQYEKYRKEVISC